MAQFARAVTREAICSRRAESGISCTAVWARLAYLDFSLELDLHRKPASTPDQVRSRLFRDHAL